MNLLPNHSVTEHLKLIRRIGEGGMGSVWLAFDSSRNREVAVKFLSPRFNQDDMARARFFREARLGSAIRSPHVAEVLECALLSDGTPYIEMEFVEGEALSKRIARKGALSIDETRQVMAQVASGIAALHAVGIVHRDVKPNNIVVREVDGHIVAKVVDLGIAKESDGAGDLTLTGTSMGTPIYMSPEQMFDSRDAGESVDLWALGVVAYECLTGKLPFNGDTFGAVCIAVHSGRFVRPTEMRPELADSVDAWFAWVFARERSERIDSIASLHETFLAMCTRRAHVRISARPHPSLRAVAPTPSTHLFHTAPSSRRVAAGALRSRATIVEVRRKGAPLTQTRVSSVHIARAAAIPARAAHERGIRAAIRRMSHFFVTGRDDRPRTHRPPVFRVCTTPPPTPPPPIPLVSPMAEARAA